MASDASTTLALGGVAAAAAAGPGAPQADAFYQPHDVHMLSATRLLFVDDGESRRDCVHPDASNIDNDDAKCFSRAVEMEVDTASGTAAVVREFEYPLSLDGAYSFSYGEARATGHRALRCIALRCVALRCVALHCVVTVRRGALPATTLLCNALHCRAVQCSAVHCIVLHCSALHCNAVQCSAVQCSTVQCIAVQYIALQCIALHCSALHCSALHCIAVQCSAVQCIALYCIALNSAPFRPVPFPSMADRGGGRLQLHRRQLPPDRPDGRRPDQLRHLVHDDAERPVLLLGGPSSVSCNVA